MKNENIHTRLLNAIYQTSQMEFLSIDNLEQKITDENFKEIIKKQREEYKEICDKSIQILIKYGQDEKEISALTKTINNVIAMLKTISDEKIGSIAKILIENSNKGIIDLTEKLNEYSNEDKEIVDLANSLINKITKNIESLKTYL